VSAGESKFARRSVLHIPILVAGGLVGSQSGVDTNAVAEELPSTLPITKKVFMDIAIDGQPAGQIVIGLFGDTVPIGAQRFAELAAGKRGIGFRRKEFYKITKTYIQNIGVRTFSLTGGVEDAAKFTGGDTAETTAEEREGHRLPRRHRLHEAAPEDEARGQGRDVRDDRGGVPAGPERHRVHDRDGGCAGARSDQHGGRASDPRHGCPRPNPERQSCARKHQQPLLPVCIRIQSLHLTVSSTKPCGCYLVRCFSDVLQLLLSRLIYTTKLVFVLH
jgi:cyclophilin family peptidyl-prolyl cis-trans isomerase